MSNEQITQLSEALAGRLGRWQWIALVLGLVGTVAAIVGYTIREDQFFRSYLLAFIYWIGLSAGSLALLMIHHLTGGRWGFATRRLLEAGTRTLPLMVLLLVPVLLGLHHLYEWTHADVVAGDPILQHKSAYLNTDFFVLRSFLYLAVLGGMAFLLNRWSTQQDRTTESHPTRRMQRLSGPGLVIYALIMTLAAVDWIMSLEPHWFSTIYSAIYIIGQILLALAFAILVAVPLSRHRPLDALLTNERLRDLGTLTLAFVMLWAYTSFSQLLIIWAGNLPEEITWYMTRLRGGWLSLGYLLIGFHFALPFLLLISSRIKARLLVLTGVALGLALMRLVDLFWITAPAFQPQELRFHWLDLAVPVGMGGLWVSWYFWQLKGRPLIAMNDPRFQPLLEESERDHG